MLCATCDLEVDPMNAHDVHDDGCHWPHDVCLCPGGPRLVCFGCCPDCQRKDPPTCRT